MLRWRIKKKEHGKFMFLHHSLTSKPKRVTVQIWKRRAKNLGEGFFSWFSRWKIGYPGPSSLVLKGLALGAGQMLLPGPHVLSVCVCCARWFHGERCQAWWQGWGIWGRCWSSYRRWMDSEWDGFRPLWWSSGASCCGLCGAFASSASGEVRNFLIVLWPLNLEVFWRLCEPVNGRRMWSVRPHNRSGDPSVRFLGMASLIGSGIALDSLPSRLADDVPGEVDGGSGDCSVREHRGLFCSGCVGKKSSS